MLIPTEIEFKDNFMIIQYKGDSIVQTINTFQKNTGVTISNPQFDIPAYVLQLKLFGTSLICGNIIENLIGYLILYILHTSYRMKFPRRCNHIYSL